MCGRFILSQPEKLKTRYKVSGKIPLFEPSWNIAPGMRTPVIVKNSPLRVVLMKWGLVPFWAKDPKIGYKMINARAEEIANKPSFRKPVRSQRCLIPADGFYEWKTLELEGKEEKVPWFIGLKDKSVFSMAGVYDVWKDAERKEIYTYAIITTTPNRVLAKIHSRMPVILAKDEEETWLDKEAPLERALKLLDPYPAGTMTAHPVSRAVNSPRSDYQGLVEEVKYPEV